MDALWYFWTLKSVCLRTWVHAVCPDVKDHVKYPVDRWGSLHREAENLGGKHRLWAWGEWELTGLGRHLD